MPMVHPAIRVGIVFAAIANIIAATALASAQDSNSSQATKAAVPSIVRVAGQTSDDDSDGTSALVVTGDFNRDGIADIAKIALHADGTSDSDNLIVLLGQLNGGFRPAVPKPLSGQNPRAMVGGDFNNDGIPDLIIGNEDGALTLFLGNGTGGFSSVYQIPPQSSVVSIAVADFNNDGILDLAVSGWRASSVTVLVGTGKGSFEYLRSFPLRMRGTKPHVAAADFNGDGVPDLAVIYEQDDGDTYDVMLGNGNGSFTIAPERGLARNPNSHCVIL
jgi:hypothetical protein